MNTNSSVERLAASLMRENSTRGHFTLSAEATDDLEMLSLQLERMGCTLSRGTDPIVFRVNFAHANGLRFHLR
jgi:hypothetical protein